ncbi:8-amino-7-oxononanoate synthase [Laribacter hongkongensis]|uniref:8-amino-7-oxononanoate synthase n=1 Tax=Laribacter hongkongensis TaxID=168471 RepID=A0A248LEH7_9NEIS|nr:8-amino-7-oxononanoate synthase [Laribacter hongkongensis]ASJ22931.1 8-amino-7-oxononanoate synthase [Laribacter hongkongensis]MCG9042162.1 8-amino-7-oxononanoate synthase [Laribacter hongkongensis]MCG9067698.1 8-amino-7-oxononanoate synthase [Laribacter hongkongensis]MCG9089611.1 8-amino-7-oxononanoate synthase [Laribacter hongkongensis]MCG9099099.1 8-amino-7-oxononanoate synthase [Laribacter hongkongensis]
MPRPADLAAGLAALDAASRRRRRPLVTTPQGPHLTVDGRDYLAFASNDYLGLANHPALVAALQEGAARFGAGAGASHLVSGHLAPHDAAETALAAFLGREAALLFSSGYQANVGVIGALVGRGDAVFADRLAHASLLDGCLLSRAEFQRFRHNDLADLERRLAASTAPAKLIAVDAVYSMDGDEAPLAALLALAERFDAWLYVDDAHGFGVLGPQGRGTLAAHGVAPHPRLVQLATFGKAAGLAGAAVTADALVIDWLVNTARTAIFTTAMPPALAHALTAMLALVEPADAARARLAGHVATLRAGCAAAGLRLLPSRTAIQPVLIGSDADAVAASLALREAGLWVPAIRPPTVPPGTARLRVSLSAAHTETDVAQLAAQLSQIMTKR